MKCAIFTSVVLALFCCNFERISAVDYNPPAIKINQVDERNKILKVLGDVPDSEVIIESVERIRLDCEAPYPVQWTYHGSGVPVLLSNIRKESEDRYTASAFINTLKEHHTGNYACSSTEYPNAISSYFYIFVPGPQLFTTNSFGNTLYIPKNDTRILIPCGITNPSSTVVLEKAQGSILLPLEIDNSKISYDPRSGYRLDITRIIKPDGVYRCTARNNGIQRSKEYVLAYPDRKSAAALEFRPNSNPDAVVQCETHTDCPPNFSCYTDHTCKDPCINSIRCGEGAICKYNDRRPYCECPVDWVGDPAKECFNTLQGSDAEHRWTPSTTTKRPSSAEPKQCRINEHCPTHEKCIKGQCADPCVSRLCARNAYCLTETHETSCQCNSGYFGDPNGVLGCGPLKLQRPDPLKQKEKVQSATCHTNRDCAADQICRTDVGRTRVCVEVCGTKICGINSECQQANSTFDLPSCVCKDSFTGNPYLNCDEISSSRDCVIDNDCQSEERCETGRNYRKCVHRCAKKTCPFNLECEAIDHEVRCVCPAGYTGSEQIGCARDVAFDLSELQSDGPRSSSSSSFEYSDVEHLVCSGLSCGPFSECRISNGQPKCFCQSGYTGSPPRCRQECETTADCPSQKTCVQKRCRNVCRNKCAQNAQCRVGTTGSERYPICICSDGYTGNAEVKCTRIYN